MRLPEFQKARGPAGGGGLDSRRKIRLAAALLTLLAVTAYFFLVYKPAQSALSGQSPPEMSAEDAALFERGRELSQTVCASCHLYPEPDVVHRFAWAFESLPKMEFWLGFEPYDYANEPGGQRVKEAKVLPTEPMLEYKDWEAICNFYLLASPGLPIPQPERPPITIGISNQFQVIIPPYPRPAANTMVKIEEGRGRIYVGNDDTNKHLDVFNVTGHLEASLPVESAPVSLTFHPSGTFVTLIGSFTPSDDPTGKLIHLDQPRAEATAAREVLTTLQRPTDALFADLNNDGREDIVVTEFGHILGDLAWYEQLEDGTYRRHVLLERSGAIKAELHDFDGDGRLDVIAMMSQGREGIYIFFNRGNGVFEMTPVTEKHPAWGFAYFELADFNGDGHMDILAVNGDNGDALAYPHPMKAYHGVRIYLNDGRNNFREEYFFPLNGAYKAVARDFNLNGKLDIAAISYFPDYQKSPAESFVYLENQGNFSFQPYSFAESISGHWICMDAGDLDGDGDVDIVLGSYVGGPGPVPSLLNEQWELRGSSILILKNLAVEKRPASGTGP